MIWLPTGSEALAADRYTQEEIGIPGIVLMERAALALFAAFEEMLCGKIPTDGDFSLSRFRKERDRILIAVENGNNGGDGLAFARLLSEAGYLVDVLMLNGIPKKSESFQIQEKILASCAVRVMDVDRFDTKEAIAERRYTVAVDAIFGVGLSRPVEGIQADIVRFMNRMPAFRLAVDIPTGISAETGRVLGEAFRADATVTFGFLKLGMMLGKGREYAGNVIMRDIGLRMPKKSGVSMVYTRGKEDIGKLLPARPVDAHKGTMGRVLVIAGSKEMCGAAILAAEAAYRTGAGLVRVLTEETNRAPLMADVPEVIADLYRELPENPENPEDYETARRKLEKQVRRAVAWADAICVGPGLGTGQTAVELLRCLASAAGMIDADLLIDADGLNILAKEPALLESFTGAGLKLILTPHIGEMNRLLRAWPDPAGQTPGDEPLGVAERFAKTRGVTLVLKSDRTVVAGKKNLYLNTIGNAGMATGGSGDVLAGILTALFAMTPKEARDRDRLAELGVLIHSAAGDAAAEEKGQAGMLAGDIIRKLPEVLKAADKNCS